MCVEMVEVGTIGHMPEDVVTVTVTCADGVWTASVEGMPEATSHTRRLSALDRQVRERLANLLGCPGDSLVLEYTLPEHSVG